MRGLGASVGGRHDTVRVPGPWPLQQLGMCCAALRWAGLCWAVLLCHGRPRPGRALRTWGAGHDGAREDVELGPD